VTDIAKPTPSPAPNEKPAAAIEPARPAHGLPPSAHPPHGKPVHQVAFTAHPKLLYAWPLILAGFLFWWPGNQPEAATPAANPPAATQLAGTNATTGQPAAVPAGPFSHKLEYLAWAYIWIALIVVLALGIDLGRNYALVLVLFIAFVWVLGVLLRDRYHFTLFGDIYRWFAERNVQYDRNLALCLSILLLVPYLFMLIWARLNDRWRITHNEFEHHSLGRSSDSLGRGAKAIRSEFPDFFEAVLGLGAGTLIVYDASGSRELRRISNVVLLPIVRRKIERILERTAVTVGQIDDEEDDDQQ
jgi:hypothetical protein